MRVDGTAYVGDTAGIRVRPGYVLPATPPPDIDLERWEESLQRIEAWQPARLYLTHFGEGDPPAAHLAMYRGVAGALRRARASVARRRAATTSTRIAAWEAWLRADVRAARARSRRPRPPKSAAPFRQLWLGLARYWRKRETRGAVLAR